MATIKINDLSTESAEARPVSLEEASQVAGGAESKPKSGQQQTYLTYKLENVLISSYS